MRKFGELGKSHTTKKNSIDDGGKYLIHLNLKLKFNYSTGYILSLILYAIHLQSSPNKPTVPSLTDAKLFPVHTTVPIVFPSSIEIELRSDNSMSLPASVRLIIVGLSLFDFLIFS